MNKAVWRYSLMYATDNVSFVYLCDSCMSKVQGPRRDGNGYWIDKYVPNLKHDCEWCTKKKIEDDAKSALSTFSSCSDSSKRFRERIKQIDAIYERFFQMLLKWSECDNLSIQDIHYLTQCLYKIESRIGGYQREQEM